MTILIFLFILYATDVDTRDCRRYHTMYTVHSLNEWDSKMSNNRIICEVEDATDSETERKEYFDAVKSQREEEVESGEMSEQEYQNLCWE